MGEKPVIGVVPLVDEEKESLWMVPGYMDGISQAGGLPLMLPLTDCRKDIEQLTRMCSGFLFTGGHDVSPELYHEEKSPFCGACCRERDAMELLLLQEALQKDQAVLGICRGIQFLNAALGGTLYQDLPTEHPSKLEHHQKPPYDRPSHSVRVVGDSPLYRLLGKASLEVNSYHHQAVRELSEKLSAMAYSPDNLVEAVYMPDKTFVWAVQWHPEFSFRVNEDSRKIFGEFVAKASAEKNF